MDNNILLIGGGGHCKAVIDIIELTNEYNIIGILDLKKNIGGTVFGYKILGSDDDMHKYRSLATYAFVTTGSGGSCLLRKKLFDKLLSIGYKIPNIISPTAYVSKHVELGIGNIIMHHSLINANVKILNNNIFNSKSLIEHDSTVGSHNYISTSANINGMVNIGENCYIGSSSVINQTLKVSDNIIIGSGAVIVKDCIEEGVYVGIPAKKI